MRENMKAAVYRRYGPPEVVHIEEIEKPVPGDNEVLIRVHATTVCAADWRMRKADPLFIRLMMGLWKPQNVHVLGMEFSGEAEAVGKSVTRFAAGDQLFGGTGFSFGAHAEYVCVPEDGNLAIKPQNMSLEESAAVWFGGFTALHFLKRANLKPGQKILIYGASGSVGVFAVQLAKHFGAHVTAVCSTSNLMLATSLGADEVLDYTRQDFSKAGQVFDVVFDAVGKSGFSRSLKALRKGGCYVRVGASGGTLSILGSIVREFWTSRLGGVNVISGVAVGTPANQLLLKALIEAGKLTTVIDRRYSINEIVEAHRFAESGHKKGHVLVLLR
jgi:NADPH:quinone reductase-like Zn-dependent oxidoreductase